MDRQTAEELLTGLGAGYDRIATAMFAIDSHPGLALLRGGGLTGRSAAVWRSLSPELDLLWGQFSALGEQLDRARMLQGARRPTDEERDELRRIIAEPALGLDGAGMPTDGTTAPVVNRIRLADLAMVLEQRCAAMAGLLSDVDAAWSAVAGRLAPLTERVEATLAQATELAVAPTVAPLRDQLTQLRTEELSDPLAAAPAGRLRPALRDRLTALEDELDTARARLTELARLRDGYQQRRETLRERVEELAGAERSVRDANARAEQKIADPALPTAPTAYGVLSNRLDDLDRLRRSGDWARLADEVGVLERSIQQATDRANALRAVADGLLARRDELRGRLDAYRAKAAGVGFIENDRLTQRYQQAHLLLFSAPCELRQATRAVFAYQQTLAELIATGDSDHSPRAAKES